MPSTSERTNAMNFGDIFVPALMVFILCYGLVKKVDIVNVFCEGATENLKIAVGLIPMLILLMTAVGMFTSSGAADIIAKLLRPVTTFLGFPEECIPEPSAAPAPGPKGRFSSDPFQGAAHSPALKPFFQAFPLTATADVWQAF